MSITQIRDIKRAKGLKSYKNTTSKNTKGYKMILNASFGFTKQVIIKAAKSIKTQSKAEKLKTHIINPFCAILTNKK